MGLSIAISGGVTLMTIMLIFGVLAVLMFQIQSETISGSKAFENNNNIAKTGINILDVNASSSSLLMNFTLINEGSEKLWDYDNFDVLVTYDANILGKRTSITEQFTYNARAFEQSTGQSVPSRDFKIQRGELIMGVADVTLPITAGAEFDECVGDCFIKLVNTRHTGNGRTAGGAPVDTDEFTTYISNDDGLRPGGLATVTFARHDTEGDTMDNRIQWEIWEYIGKNQTGNQMKVWDTGTCTYTLSDTVCNGAAIPEFSGTDSKVVVFITGQANPKDNLTEFPDCMSTSEWILGTNIPRFTRIGAGAGGTTLCDLSYAVVEFSGNNWSVQRIEHEYIAASSVQTETISDVGDVNQAFFHYQQRNEDAGNAEDPCRVGAEIELLTSDTLTYRLPQTTSGWDSSMQSVTWIISNSETYSSEKPIVQHLNPPERLTGGGEENNWQVAITPLTYDTSETALTGLTAQAAACGNTAPQGSLSAILTDSSTVDFYQADTSTEVEYTFQVVQFPRSHKCIDGTSNNIAINEWTINCIMYDDVDPGLINPSEVAEVLLKLEYPLFTNGFIDISVSTDNGKSITKTTTAT